MASAGGAALAETLAHAFGLGQQLHQQDVQNDLAKQQAAQKYQYQQDALGLQRNQLAFDRAQAAWKAAHSGTPTLAIPNPFGGEGTVDVPVDQAYHYLTKPEGATITPEIAKNLGHPEFSGQPYSILGDIGSYRSSATSADAKAFQLFKDQQAFAGKMTTPEALAQYAKIRHITNPIIPAADANGNVSWDQFFALNKQGIGLGQAQTDLANSNLGNYGTPQAAQNYINEAGLGGRINVGDYALPDGRIDMVSLRKDVESAPTAKGRVIANEYNDVVNGYKETQAETDTLLKGIKLDQTRASQNAAQAFWNLTGLPKGKAIKNLSLKDVLDIATGVAANGGTYTLRQVLGMANLPTTGYTDAELDQERQPENITAMANAIKAMLIAHGTPAEIAASVISKLAGAAKSGQPDQLTQLLAAQNGVKLDTNSGVDLSQFANNPALAPYVQGLGTSPQAAPFDAQAEAQQILANVNGDVAAARASIEQNRQGLKSDLHLTDQEIDALLQAIGG